MATPTPTSAAPANGTNNSTNSTADAPVLELENITVSYRQGQQWLDAVRDVSFKIQPGETMGLVGESGSGKSTLAHAVLRYLSENGAIRKGRILLRGQDMTTLSNAQLRQVWAEEIKLVPQNALSALNPSLTIGDQLLEAIPPGRERGPAQVQELLKMVRLADSERVADNYPHQLSGGMQQRVMIAMALAAEPALLVMDEPTTALDVTTEAAILDLVAGLIDQRQTAVLYVTHDLGVIAQVCDRVAVLYAGELVEEATVDELFAHPLHPYTAGLLASVPRLGATKGTNQLYPIRGSIPQLTELPHGCIFAPRCPIAEDRCFEERPPLEEAKPGRHVRCLRWQEIDNASVSPLPTDQTLSGPGAPGSRPQPAQPAMPVLRIENLDKHFTTARSLLQWLLRKPSPAVRAVENVTLDVPRSRTLGLVGESGSGKTTLARCIIGLEEATGGEMRLLDVPLTPALSRRAPEVLRQLQIVFQNPDEALNPYRTVANSLRRPLMRLSGLSTDQAEARVLQLLEMVNLRRELADRLPGQLSGGEKQRVAIARAFAAQPELLIFDESVSALDVSVQVSILNLLNELQHASLPVSDNPRGAAPDAAGRAYLFITHDLGVVSYLADELAVIYLGQLMEVGAAEAFFKPPYHPYTEVLLAAAPVADPRHKRPPLQLEGEIPSPSAKPQGCPFHTRCPRVVGDICRTETPPWRTGPDGQRIFCHIPLEELEAAQAPLATPDQAARTAAASPGEGTTAADPQELG
ncbi:MAG: ABC transporter ATP-binding protein [Litorilinea sp.]